MRKYLLLGSVVLGLGLCVGCGDGSVTTAPLTEAEIAEQAAEMEAMTNELAAEKVGDADLKNLFGGIPVQEYHLRIRDPVYLLDDVNRE